MDDFQKMYERYRDDEEYRSEFDRLSKLSSEERSFMNELVQLQYRIDDLKIKMKEAGQILSDKIRKFHNK